MSPSAATALFAVLSMLVALLVAGVVYVGSQTQPERPLGLPTTPDAWERVVIDAEAEGDVGALAAGPRGLVG